MMHKCRHVVGLEAKYCLELSKTLRSNADGGMFQTYSLSNGGVAATTTYGRRGVHGGAPEEHD